jgi:hypothetical protein
VLVTLVTLALAACSATSPGRGGAAHRSGAAQSTPAADAAKVAAYGTGVTPSAQVTYQPDVVVVGGGPDTVRSVSADALTWTIDAHAPGADRLAPGKVMLLTSRAAGRVLGLRRSGDDLRAVLGPVELTDIVKDGHFTVDRPLDPSALWSQTYPDAPGTLTKPSDTPSTGSHFAPTVQLNPPLPPPSRGSTTEVSVGPFAVEGSVARAGNSATATAKITYTSAGLTFGGTVEFAFAAPTVQSDITITNGRIAAGRFVLAGLQRVRFRLESGSTGGLSSNVKGRIEVPAEINEPFLAGPVPMNLSFRFKFLVEPVFTARNSTLSASAVLRLAGPVTIDFATGTSGTQVHGGAASELTKAIDTIGGTSIGVNGFVFAAQVKLLIGVGTPIFSAGPFVAFTVSFGLTLGSSAGIVQCRQASTDLVVGGGIGLTVAQSLADRITSALSRLGLDPGHSPQAKLDTEFPAISRTLLHDVWVKPPVTACK